MKFDDLIQRLNEGTSPLRRLYHYTRLHKAVSILQKDRFELTFSARADANVTKSNKRNFFLSTSTIPTGEYGMSEGKYYSKSGHVLFELDASKISDNYKIAPVDYWYMPELKKRMSSKDETEERILSTKSNIPNAKKYIVAVHVYLPPSEGTQEDISMKDEVNKIAQSGVDYYIYDDVQSFAGLQKSRAHKIESSNHQYELEKFPRIHRSQEKWDKKLHDEIDWIINPTKENTNRDYLYRDFVNGINADIHNAKRDMRPATQSAMQKLANHIRKKNKSLDELIKDAQDKGNKIMYPDMY